MAKLPLSVAIISYNEEVNIRRTLESIAPFAAEIILVDSHSTDRTREIASEFGAEVFEEDWKGFMEQKNSALSKCTQEWILCLDCDEVLTEDLQSSLSSSLTQTKFVGFRINRRTVYLGKILHHAWQPDKKLRLVRRDAKPIWNNTVHESLSITGNISDIKGELLHYSYRDIRHHFEKTVYYAYHTSLSYHDRGKKPSIGKLILNPIYSFIRNYIFQHGFLDGIHGFIAAMSAFVYVFLKYAFLWEMRRNGKKDK
ncbi:MAG: glycosyltransferase family 2 protein [Ignavibacteriae bacterium]|nr:glycosyltransferase family 2 protein [Ignavibacteriota bacterium]